MSINTLTDKRLRGELRDLAKNKLEFAQAIQDESDKLLFYFLLKGDKDGDFVNGYYIGKIILPKDYPDSPADFMMLTPNGKFTNDKKICMSNSGFHKESWTPIWNIRNMLVGLYSFFYDDNSHGISHIKDTPENRRTMACDSHDFNIKYYFDVYIKFDQFINLDGSIKTNHVPDLIKQTVNAKQVVEAEKVVEVVKVVEAKQVVEVVNAIEAEKAVKAEKAEKVVKVVEHESIFDKNLDIIINMKLENFEIEPYILVCNYLSNIF